MTVTPTVFVRFASRGATLLALTLLGAVLMPFPAPTLLALTSEPADPGRTDTFGGVPSSRESSPSTALFHIQRRQERWLLITPHGNPFWLRAVEFADPNTSPYVTNATAKYGDTTTTWARQTVRRLRAWGFNALGEGFSPQLSPVGMLRRPGNTEKMPFVRIVGATHSAYRSGKVKNLLAGVNRTIYTGWRGQVPDVFDPAYEAHIAHLASTKKSEWTEADITTSPWLIGVTADDGDYFHGFKSADQVHPAWVVAITAPSQSNNPVSNAAYPDPVAHSKLEFRNFLSKKYAGRIQALNTAWGSSYTTFGSAGPWRSGSGLLDEDGRSPWLRTRNYATLADLPKPVREDLDQFLESMADHLFGVWGRALRAAHPHHLIFGPAALIAVNRPQVLRAAGRHFDAIQLSADLARVTDIVHAYDIARKPVFLWTGITAQRDSPWAGRPGPVTDNPTQAARGDYYAKFLEALFNLRAGDGSHPVIGISWWTLYDSRRESTNWGLVTERDNAYDGREAQPGVGVDQWGYATGREAAHYGDFLTRVRETNSLIDKLLGVGGP
jgi:hypothetical protein